MANIDKTLFITDADLSKQVCIFASINERRELVVEYRFEDDNAPCRNFTRLAIVDSESSEQMAEYYRVAVEELPQLLFDECGVVYESTPSRGDAVFKQALDIILDSGMKYRFRTFD